MEASLDHSLDGDRLFLRPLGEWVIDEANLLDRKLRDLFAGLSGPGPQRLVIDLSEVDHLDTAGAFLLARAERRFVDAGGEVDWTGADKARVALVKRVREALAGDDGPYRYRHSNLLEDVGATIVSVAADARRLMLILGGTVQEFVSTTFRH